MFTLGVRLWTGKEMAYPSRFSVLLDFESRISSMRTYMDNNKIDSKTYMMLTPGRAINGEIYEFDVICNCEKEDIVGIVEFDSSLGAFIVKTKEKVIYVTDKMDEYEIIGNIFEDWDFVKEYIAESDYEKYEKIKAQAQEEALENQRQNELKAQKEKEKRERKEKELEEQKQKENETLLFGEDENQKEQTIIESSELKKEEQEIIQEESQNINQEKIIKENAEPIIEDTTQQEPLIEGENNESPQEDEPEIELPEIPEDIMSNNLNENDISEFSDFNENIQVIEEPEPEMPEPEFDIAEEEIDTNIRLFVDGYGGKTEGIGSYAYIMQCGDYEREDSGAEKQTTKQRMELKAVIEALNAITAKCNIKIYTTSQYLIVPFLKGWITRWKANDWRKESNDEVKNRDLWEQLYDLYSSQNIEWEFVKPGASIVEILRCADLSKDALSKL